MKVSNRIMMGLCMTGVALFAGLAQAEVLLYLDAAAPGPDPANSWKDLTNNNQPFTRTGTVTYSAGTQSYIFGGAGRFLGAGADESNFDFETEKFAGVGNGDEFTVLLYYKQTGGDNSNAVSKLSSSQTGGFTVSPRGPARGWLDSAQQSSNFGAPTFTQNRFRRSTIPQDTGWHLAVVTYDATGNVSGLTNYLDGNVVPDNGSPNDGMTTASATNNEVLSIGGFSNQDVFIGEIGFVEIHSGLLNPQQISNRWNNGSPLRAPEYIPEPASLAMLGVGGLMLLRRRR